VDVLRTKRELNQGFGDALSRAFEFAATIALFAGLGWLLDRWWHTKPVFLLVLLLFGVIGNFVRFWYAYDAQMKRHEADLVQSRQR
jgi:F0F1-type ATP synthase assembly protein I